MPRTEASIFTEYRVISIRGEHFSRRKGNRGLIIEANVTSEHINIRGESGGWGEGCVCGGGGGGGGNECRRIVIGDRSSTDGGTTSELNIRVVSLVTGSYGGWKGVVQRRIKAANLL